MVLFFYLHFIYVTMECTYVQSVIGALQMYDMICEPHVDADASGKHRVKV